ncbi:hypothetical protein [Pannonibacter indicus]
MFSAVSSRSGEIATLRALGFARLPAFLAVWIEAICLAGPGVALSHAGGVLPAQTAVRLPLHKALRQSN